jgi:succinate dehydrogenase / fumarate reductase, cytochrome b subunit
MASPSPGHPRYFQRGRWAQLVEGLRYGGGIGQWSWLIHRLTGIGILLFLIVHIIDTFFVVAWPWLYDEAVTLYSGVWFWNKVYYWPLRWGFRVAELGLIASVLFHSVNGVRIVAFDFWPKGTLYQRQIFWITMIVFWGIMIPVSFWVLSALAYPPAHPGLP